MEKPAGKRAPYEDLEYDPRGRHRRDIDAELVVTPRPSPEHAHAASLLVVRIGPAYASGGGGGPGGWVILDEPEVLFPGRGEHLSRIWRAGSGSASSDPQSTTGSR